MRTAHNRRQRNPQSNRIRPTDRHNTMCMGCSIHTLAIAGICSRFSVRRIKWAHAPTCPTLRTKARKDTLYLQLFYKQQTLFSFSPAHLGVMEKRGDAVGRIGQPEFSVERFGHLQALSCVVYDARRLREFLVHRRVAPRLVRKSLQLEVLAVSVGRFFRCFDCENQSAVLIATTAVMSQFINTTINDPRKMGWIDSTLRVSRPLTKRKKGVNRFNYCRGIAGPAKKRKTHGYHQMPPIEPCCLELYFA